MITLVDGTVVASDSTAWLRECEARFVLKLPFSSKKNFYDKVLRFRGNDGLKALQAAVSALEPHFVLALPSLEERRRYATLTADWFGMEARSLLEERVRALWKKSKK